MTFLIAALIVALIYLIIFSINKLLNYYKSEKNRKFVQWVTSDNNQEYRLGLSLHTYLNDARIKNKLSEKYAIITKQEKVFEEEILNEFKKFIVETHLNDNLNLIKSRYVIPEELNFFDYLYRFLCKHEYDSSFAGHNMHSETISHKKYDSGGFADTYKLSDFAVVYYKIQLIALNGYMNNNLIEIKGNMLQKHSDDLKELIDSKQIYLEHF